MVIGDAVMAGTRVLLVVVVTDDLQINMTHCKVKVHITKSSNYTSQGQFTTQEDKCHSFVKCNKIYDIQI